MSLDTQTTIPKLDTPFVEADFKEPGKGRLIALPWYRLLIALWNRTGGSQGSSGTTVPTGTIVAYGGDVAPGGYLLCNGAEIQVAAAPELFAVIGRKFGPGDGVNSFNLPDGRGRMAYGAGGTIAVGDTGGSADHTISINELAAHNHTIPAANAAAAGPPFTAVVGTNAAASGTVADNTTGLTQTFSILNPYFGINWIIKT